MAGRIFLLSHPSETNSCSHTPADALKDVLLVRETKLNTLDNNKKLNPKRSITNTCVSAVHPTLMKNPQQTTEIHQMSPHVGDAPVLLIQGVLILVAAITN